MTATPEQPTPAPAPSFTARLDVESRERLVERTKVALVGGAVIYPAFLVLDWVAHPQLLGLFLVYRIAVDVLFALGFVALMTRWRLQLANVVSIIVVFGAALGLVAMTTFLGGFTSTYYIGILMALFVAGLFMPWDLYAAGTFCGTTVASYVIINLWFVGPDFHAGQMAVPLSFLIGTSAMAMLASDMSQRLRRRDLTNRMGIERANAELKKLDEAKTRFFANVSHELRTPLTMILGPLDTMLDSRRTEKEERPLLESMSSNGRRLLRQVNALLDVAKAESGRLHLDLEEGNVGELLENLVTAAVPAAERRSVELIGEGLETIPDTVFDVDKVEIIAANLISNALKFTAAGGRVSVRGWNDEDAEDLVFEVRDTGTGIPEEQLEKIFDRFHQVDDTTSRSQEGTGLGLALARELARLHGGDIECESRLGEGACFRVRIPHAPQERIERRRKPRRRADKMAAMRVETLAAKHYEERAVKRTLLADVEVPRLRDDAVQVVSPTDAPKLLVVEDNADLRTFVASQLARTYRVTTAEDGVAGLEAARRIKPDIIVTDVNMPRMDGRELCRRIKSDPALAATPVIVVTARAGADAVVQGLDVGADDYVTKPFDMRELHARVAAHIRGRVLERSLRERDTRLAAIGRMASAIVHDLKNPLASVVGYTELARMSALEGLTGSEIAQELAPVLKEAQRLRRMIQEILDFARSGSMQLSHEPTPVAAWLRGVVGPMREELERSGVTCELDLDLDDGFCVRLDRDRMHRVLENLVINAREALAQPGQHSKRRTLWVRASVEEESLLIRIADNGPGIAPDVAERLFQPFATAGKKHGTGLGLVTVRNLMKAHGGEVRAEPKAPEGGAAFTLRIPCTLPGSQKPELLAAR